MRIFVLLIVFFSLGMADDVNFNQSDENKQKFQEVYIQPNEKMIEKMREENNFLKSSSYKDKFKNEINQTTNLLKDTDLKQDIKNKVDQALKNNDFNISQIQQTLKSQEFKDKFDGYTQSILEQKEIADKAPGLNKQKLRVFHDELKKYAEVKKEKIFIVLSSSMPDYAIKQYFKMLNNINGVEFIFRGLIKDDLKSFKPTMDYFQHLLKIDENGEYTKNNVYSVNLSINPKVVRKYKIDKVPAFIYIQNYDSTIEDARSLKDSNNTNEKVWIKYGLISPFYVINKINKEANSQWLSSILTKDSFFDKKSQKPINKNQSKK